MKRQTAHGDAPIRRAPREHQSLLGIATKFARQIAHRPGASEGDAQQELGAVGEGCELIDLVGIVGDESAHAKVQGISDVALGLDGVRVDAARGEHP
jgi:hypothetical protein